MNEACTDIQAHPFLENKVLVSDKKTGEPLLVIEKLACCNGTLQQIANLFSGGRVVAADFGHTEYQT